MAYPTNIGRDRFGGSNTDKPQRRISTAQQRNLSHTDKYPLNDYSADKRFKNSGAFGLGGKKKGGGFQFPLGGFGGGGRGGAAFSKEDLDRQLEYDRKIWERSTPNVGGVGGSVTWDRDTNTVSSKLSDENQDIYDAAYKRQGMFGGLADDMAGGGWKQMQQDRFNEMRGLYAEEDAMSEARRLEREQNTGASTTSKYWGERGAGDTIAKRNLMLQNQAFAESQGLLDSNLNRQNQAVGMMGNLGNRANSMVVTPTPNTVGNMGNVSTASTRWADNLAMEDAKKAKGKSDFFGSLLGSLFG
jgi:hypothetical protein